LAAKNLGHRAAAHKDRKLARKAGSPVATTAESQSNPALADAVKPVAMDGIPEPGLPFPSRASISLAQLTADRANAQSSTGPKTEAGRATSSQNRTTHGLARHNGVFLLLSSEDPNGFEALKAALAEEHQPSTETESILINSMAESHWLAQRAQTLKAVCFDPQTAQIANEKFTPAPSTNPSMTS
jgi:hypothetical protein